jgi:putative transposase
MMAEERREQVALFRFSVINDLVGGVRLERGELERLIKDKSQRKWYIPGSNRTRVSASTIRRWIRIYGESGRKLESLNPVKRSDRGRSRAIDEETVLALIRLRGQMPRMPVKDLIRVMKKRGLITPGVTISLSTAYRMLKQADIARPRVQPVDRRRYEAEHPNDIWQADVLHGPSVTIKGKKRKAYLIAFLDDHSRLIPHAQFYPSERLECFLDALRQALLTRGVCRKLYVDNGAAFRSRHLEFITASLGIALIHSRPYVPQGRGKVERFFRTVRSQLLSGFRGSTLEELNLALGCWLRDRYHQRKHSSTGQSPLERFTEHVELLRTAPANLEDFFRKVVRRRVAKDRTVSLNNRLYEAPIQLIGRRVQLLYHDHQPEQVEVRAGDRSYGLLVPLDLNVNCRVKREKNGDQIEGQDKREYRGGVLHFGREEVSR